MIDISFIVPVYNNEKTIEHCLDSILVQDGASYEILVVDDASTDDSFALIAAYAERHPGLIRPIRLEENRGSGNARNTGLDAARGTYAAFVDADDLLAETFTRSLFTEAVRTGADIACCAMVMVRQNPWREEMFEITPGTWKGEDSLERLLLRRCGNFGACSKLYSRSFLRKNTVRFGETRLHQDVTFNIQAFYFSKKTLVIPDIGYYNCIRKDSSTQTAGHERRMLSFIQCVGFMTRFFLEHGLSLDSQMYRHAVRMLYCWDRHGFCSAINEADEAGRLAGLLTDDLLAELASSREALRLLLTDWAVQHCFRQKIHPVVLPEERDWKKKASLPRPPRTYRPYGGPGRQREKPPLLTVFVANFNKAQYLERCLDSILRQTMEDYELIVMDDASTDASYEILRGYADKTPRMRLFRMDHNSSQAVCNNIAIKELARGRYITFVDSDDWIEPGFFQKSIDLIRQKKADIVCFAKTVAHQDGTLEPRPLAAAEYSGQKALDRLLAPSSNLWDLHGKLFDLNWLKSTGILFPEYVFHQATVFGMRIFNASRSCVTSREYGYVWALTPDSACRPRAYDYRHIHTEFTIPLLKYSAMRAASAPDYMRLAYNAEEFLLPLLCGYYHATGDIPLPEEAFAMCAVPDILRVLCLGFARCYEKGPVPFHVLVQLPRGTRTPWRHSAPEQPALSVIIPIYNQESHICRCLDSVTRQSLRNMEIIIVDDASTDRTPDICRQYAANDGRITVLTNPVNRGQGFSRNRALEAAKGKYVTYVDSDDYVLPDFFLHALALLEHTPEADVCYFNHIFLRQNGRKEVTQPPAVQSGREVFSGYCFGKLLPFAPWTKVYRASLLKEHGILFPVYFFEDNLFTLRVCLHARNFLFSGRCGYVRCEVPHPASTMAPIRLTPKHLEGVIRLAADSHALFAEHFSGDAGKEELAAFNKRLAQKFRTFLPYIGGFSDSPGFPVDDDTLAALEAAPEFVKYLFSDYARLYATSTETACPPELEEDSPLPDEVQRPVDLVLVGEFAAGTQRNPLVSVIIAVSDETPSPADCLKSIFAQAGETAELVLVGDGLSDSRVLELNRSITNGGIRARLFKTPWACGKELAWNLALREAQGTYVLFVNADGRLAPGALPGCFAAVGANPEPPDIIMGNHVTITEHTAASSRIPEGRFTGKEMFANHAADAFRHSNISSVLFNRKFLKDHSITFPFACGGDDCFLIESLMKATDIVTLPLAIYEEHSTAKQNTFHINFRNFSCAVAFLKCIDRLFQENYPGDTQNTVHINLIYKMFIKGTRKKEILCYIHACSLNQEFSVMDVKQLLQIVSSKRYLALMLVDYAALAEKSLPIFRAFSKAGSWEKLGTLAALGRTPYPGSISAIFSSGTSRMAARLFCALKRNPDGKTTLDEVFRLAPRWRKQLAYRALGRHLNARYEELISDSPRSLATKYRESPPWRKLALLISLKRAPYKPYINQDFPPGPIHFLARLWGMLVKNSPRYTTLEREYNRAGKFRRKIVEFLVYLT